MPNQSPRSPGSRWRMSGPRFIASKTCWSASFIEEGAMACDELPDNLKILWKEAGTDRPKFSPEQLRQETEKMRAKRRKSDVIMAAAMALLVAGYGIIFFFIPNNALTLAGSILSVLVCGAWLIDILMKRARVAPDPGETDSVRFLQNELERARDHRRTLAWRLALL